MSLPGFASSYDAESETQCIMVSYLWRLCQYLTFLLLFERSICPLDILCALVCQLLEFCS